MEENAALSAKSLIEQENRQYNETNALYHAAAVQFGLSDTAFWILYALYSSAAPLTQVQMCAEWCLPKQIFFCLYIPLSLTTISLAVGPEGFKTFTNPSI